MRPNRTESNNPNYFDLARQIGVRYGEPEEETDCGCSVDDETDEESSEDQIDSADGKHHLYNRVVELESGGYTVHLEPAWSSYLEDIEGTAELVIPGTYLKEYSEDEGKKKKDHNQLVIDERPWLLQYHIGYGRVTVLNDFSLFTNNRLSDRDHAFFLAHLVEGAEKVWLLYSADIDSFWTLLWRKVPRFWLSLLVTLVLAGWMYQLRSGPRQKLLAQQSRSILAHIEATGRYYWRTDRCREIVSANREGSISHWMQRYRGAHAGNEMREDDMKRLHEKTGMSREEIEGALRFTYSTEQDFIRLTQAMQKLGMALQGGEKKRND